MKHSEIVFGVLRIPFDALLTGCALLLAYWFRIWGWDFVPGINVLSGTSTLPPLSYYTTHFALPAVGIYLVLLAFLRLYELKTTFGPWREMGRVAAASGLWIAVIIAWFFLIQKQLFFSRILLLQATALITVFVMMERAFILLVQREFLRHGIGKRTVVSCGNTSLPDSVREHLSEDVRFEYLGHVGNYHDVSERQRQRQIDLILHTDPSPESDETARLIDYCRSHQIGYAFLPPVFADVPQQLSISHLGLTPMLQFEPTPLDGWGRVWKRATDVTLGTLFLLLTSPFFLLIALAIFLSSGRPIFYVSTRVGQFGRKHIPVLKFRTMCVDADERKKELEHLSHRRDGPLFKIKGDPRITCIGRFLRRWSLDELPQLLNVIYGHLSLVGPRAHLPDEVARYTERQRRVFTVRPGLTGLAQISGRSGLSFEEEVLRDMRYIEDWSPGIVLWILWRTIFVVLGGREAD